MKECGKCGKTVYPTEELKCLDKVWHKACFKCQVCNMALNMKNYKGYDKMPFCNAHYPQTKHTAIADTPDMKRVQENTKIQSNVLYHSDFEKSKGQCVQIADTLDMQRNLQNTKNTSLIKYHEDFEKEKGKYHLVTDDPVTLRAKQTMQTISNVEYHQVRERRESQEMRRPAEQVTEFTTQVTMAPLERRQSDVATGTGQVKVRRDPGRIADYDPDQAHTTGGGTPYSSRSSANMVYDSKSGRDSQDQWNYKGHNNEDRAPVKRFSVKNRVQRFSLSGDEDQMESSQTRKVGSISDYDPVNERYGSIVGQYHPDPRKEPPAPQPSHSAPQSYQPPHQPPHQPHQPPHQPPPQQYQPPPPQSPRGSGKGLVCQALYDYNAADEDEVSFAEGDMIVFCQPIDQGWMEGTVERTGNRGMLPSNYVERM